ncbi:MAG: helix-turn-helix domain-containing protein [Dehalococcoidia bacterium]
MNVKTRNRKAGQAEATRVALMAAAREMFAERGYSGVSAEEIVARAGVTRGALYHHFEGKKGLFAAVYEEIERETVERIAARALEGADIWDASQIGWRAFLDECRDPAVSRIALLDAPSVLGLEHWREIADRYGGAMVRANLEALMDAGEIERQPVVPAARILTGALIEGAIAVAEAPDPDAAIERMSGAVERLFAGLRLKTQ